MNESGNNSNVVALKFSYLSNIFGKYTASSGFVTPVIVKATHLGSRLIKRKNHVSKTNKS